MPRNNKDHKQDLDIARVEGRVDAVENDITEIKAQLTNHIPTQITKINDKVDALSNKILFGFVAMIAITVVLQIVLKAF